MTSFIVVELNLENKNKIAWWLVDGIILINNTDWNQRTSYYLLSLYATPRSPYKFFIILFLFYKYFVTNHYRNGTSYQNSEKNAAKFRYRASCAIYGIEKYEQFNLPVAAGVRRIYCLAESTLLQPTCKRYVICWKTYSSLSVIATPTLKLYVVSPGTVYPFVEDWNEGDCSRRLNPEMIGLTHKWSADVRNTYPVWREMDNSLHWSCINHVIFFD